MTKNDYPTNRPDRETRNQQETERIQRWRWMLDQNVPVIGGWMHRRITSALTESALAGNWLAAQSLAIEHVYHQESEVRRLAGETLQKINYTTGIDAVWGVWAETRHPGLEKIALSYNRAAGHPASVRLLSALCMNALNLITHGSADLIPALIQALDDRDPRMIERAREAILHLHTQESIDALLSTWLDSRYPFLGDIVRQAGYVAAKPPAVRVLSALFVNQLEVLKDSTPDMVPPLVNALQHANTQIAARARTCLLQLREQSAVDAFCRLWNETRSPVLEDILMQAGYKARSPLNVRLLVALKTGFLQTAQKANREGLPTLLDALKDPDETIRSNAQIALSNLKNEDTREALCVRVIEKDDPVAREIALANGYAPRTPDLRALFYFLTEQWQAYDILDFDQSILRAIYETSQPDLRQRIASRVQAAGRTDYLTILAGVDYRSRAERVNPTEAALMIRILAENREYTRLWSLTSELALPFSLQIVQLLRDQGWQPADEADQALFAELVELSNQPILLDPAELARVLPLAIPRSTLKIRGRVNDAAFSPTRPVLAIASSHRKIVLWNFQTASVEQLIEGFAHSVGKVNFTPLGILVAAERTSTQADCHVYVCHGQENFLLGQHTGTVTVLEPVGQDRLLTAGRDQKAAVWDLASRKLLAQKEFTFWARSAAVSPDQHSAALLHDRLSLVRLPELTVVPGYPFLAPRVDRFKSGIAQNAAFAPDGRFLLTGQYNGQVGLYYHTSQTQRPRRAVLTRHNQPVRGVHFLPGHPLVITAGAEGQVRFIRWPDMTLEGMVYSPEGQLTSLRVSHNGGFMATGTNEASLMLWDLRVQDIPGLFTQPLATATHDQVSNVLALSEYYSLPDGVRNGLRFMRLLLQYRFRYDIQIEEAPIIRYGEFDIIVDDL